MGSRLGAEVRKAMSDYANASVNDPQSFEKSLVRMEQYGVDAFGYRVIDRTGKSAVFSTSIKWHGINKNPKFLSQMSNHVNSEVLYVKQNNLSFITRSSDRANTPYLRELGESGMNNSVLRFIFHQDKVEIFYYIPASNRPELRDLILNNLSYLGSISDSVASSLKSVIESFKFQNQKERLLEDSTVEMLWKNSSKRILSQGKPVQVNYNQRNIFLSIRELECLSFLKLGLSSKFIANKLDLSESTVKDHISNIKRKFSVQCKDSLIEIMQRAEMRYLNQLTEIL